MPKEGIERIGASLHLGVHREPSHVRRNDEVIMGARVADDRMILDRRRLLSRYDIDGSGGELLAYCVAMRGAGCVVNERTVPNAVP